VKGLPYGQRVDLWAQGIMLFEMTGYRPFYYDDEDDSTDEDNYDENLFHKINNEVFFPENMSLAAVSIAEKVSDYYQKCGIKMP
jgi:hypothetical protein